MERMNQAAVDAEFKALTEGLDVVVDNYEDIEDPIKLGRLFLGATRYLNKVMREERAQNTTDVDIAPIFMSLLKHKEQLGIGSDGNKEKLPEINRELVNRLDNDLAEQQNGIHIDDPIEIRNNSIIIVLGPDGSREIVALSDDDKVSGFMNGLAIAPLPLESDLADFHNSENSPSTLATKTDGQRSVVVVLKNAAVTTNKGIKNIPDGYTLAVPLYIMRTKISHVDSLVRAEKRHRFAWLFRSKVDKL